MAFGSLHKSCVIIGLILQVRSMEAVGVRPDTHTFTTLLDGYCRNGQLDKAEALLAKMEDSKPNQRPSIYTYNIFTKACASKVKHNFHFDSLY